MIAIVTNAIKKGNIEKCSFKFAANYRSVVRFQLDYTENQSSIIPPFPQVFLPKKFGRGLSSSNPVKDEVIYAVPLGTLR